MINRITVRRLNVKLKRNLRIVRAFLHFVKHNRKCCHVETSSRVFLRVLQNNFFSNDITIIIYSVHKLTRKINICKFTVTHKDIHFVSRGTNASHLEYQSRGGYKE